jgi:4-hydroxy-tetrahydrodipicolinate synthase
MLATGAIAPMASPVSGATGDVDERALRRYTEFLVDGGVHGLFPCGSIGEFTSLTPDQRRRVVEVVVDASGDVPVYAGCGDTSLPGVAAHVDAAAAAGADAAVVVTPYYLSTTQSGLERFLRSVADDAALPVVLYNIPGLTGQRIAVETASALAVHENVVGIKDTTGDLGNLFDLVAETPADFRVLQGATDLAVASLDAGADGLVAGPANFLPAAVASLVEAHRDGDRETAARTMQETLVPVLRAMADVPTAAAVKHLVGVAGHDVGDPLPPLPELNPDDRALLERRFEQVVGTDPASV